MEASVTDPEGSTELCEIMDEEDFHYRMMFTPQMEGTHTISIKHKGLHISGTVSLFLFYLVYFFLSERGLICRIIDIKLKQQLCLPPPPSTLWQTLEVQVYVFLFDLPGSPFVYSVGQLASGGTHKVQVGGPGVEKGEVGVSSKYNDISSTAILCYQIGIQHSCIF